MSTIEKVAENVEQLKESPGSFDVVAHLQGASHATDEVSIYTNGDAGWRVNKLQDEITQAEIERAAIDNDDSGIVPSPEWEAADEKVKALEAELEKAVEETLSSRLTFTVRGVPFPQLELIFKKVRKAIKPPARKNFDRSEEGEEEFNLATLERDIERNELLNYEMVAASIVKVADFEGREDKSAWTPAKVEALRASVYESEWFKLKETCDMVTSTQKIFAFGIEGDADFLSKR